MLRTLPSQTPAPGAVPDPPPRLGGDPDAAPAGHRGGVGRLCSPPGTHRAAPKLDQPPPAAHLAQVRPCSTCAHDYNPDAISGPKNQNPDAASRSTATRTRAWLTEHYYNGSLQKPGVGIYVDVSRPVAAREIVLYTPDPGFRAQVYGSNSPPDPAVFDTGPGGWTSGLGPVGPATRQRDQADARRTRLPLLPGLDHLAAARQDARAINEVALYRLTR